MHECRSPHVVHRDDLVSLVASTFLGGAEDCEEFFAISVTAQSVFVTGGTYSDDFPTTPGAFDTTCEGMTDGFVSHLDGDAEIGAGMTG